MTGLAVARQRRVVEAIGHLTGTAYTQDMSWPGSLRYREEHLPQTPLALVCMAEGPDLRRKRSS